MQLRTALPWTVALLAAAAPLASQEARDHAHHGEQLGRVTFPTSCSADAQPRFERAVALLHSFWWSEARAAFRSVADADPTCAMAYWGAALVARGNWFAGAPGPDAVKAGLEAAEKAMALRPPTERERGYVAAVHTLFHDAERRDYRTRALAYEEAMRALAEAHPDDPEAATFHALAVTANATSADKTFARQKQAGAILAALFEARPDHPGLAHYLIHNYDAPPIAHLGVQAAERYGRIAPAVPHAQHMPSHIFTRLGLWDESIRANLASAESAREYEQAQRATAVSFDRAHAWDYLAYAYLQQARDGEARRLVEEVSRTTATPSIATDYAFAAIPARFALERGRWADAAALPVRPSPGFRAGEAITHFARGIGAARSGDLETARAAVAELAALRDELAAKREAYWTEIVQAQRLAVDAWIALREGAPDEALRRIVLAAEIEERVDKHPVTPGPILPAREIEGDLLLELGRPADALRSYEATLRTEPNRARAVYGAALAAEKAGDAAAARARFAEYVELTRNGEQERDEVRAARTFVERGR